MQPDLSEKIRIRSIGHRQEALQLVCWKPIFWQTRHECFPGLAWWRSQALNRVSGTPKAWGLTATLSARPSSLSRECRSDPTLSDRSSTVFYNLRQVIAMTIACRTALTWKPRCSKSALARRITPRITQTLTWWRRPRMCRPSIPIVMARPTRTSDGALDAASGFMSSSSEGRFVARFFMIDPV
jgi:hypothetical protein